MSENNILKIKSSSKQNTLEKYRKMGWHIIELPDTIKNEDDFFNAVHSTFPLSFPIHRKNMNLLGEAAWLGIAKHKDDYFAIFCPLYSLKNNPELLYIVTYDLEDIVNSVRDPEINTDPIKNIKLVYIEED